VISFDLKCSRAHVFEVWFRSSTDYDAQRGAGHLICPVCGDEEIGKAVMAPAVAAKGNRRESGRKPEEKVSSATVPMAMARGDAERMGQLMRALTEEQAKVLAQSEWVGDSFAERARAMHYGETEQRIIHGAADPQETREMLEEGIPVAPLLVPIAPPDQTH